MTGSDYGGICAFLLAISVFGPASGESTGAESYSIYCGDKPDVCEAGSVTRYRVFPANQTVIAIYEHGGVERLPNCTVFDVENWACADEARILLGCRA